MNSRLIFAPLAISLGMFSHGQEAPRPYTVEVDVLFVRIPEATALPLVPSLRDTTRAAQTRDTILKLIADRKAVLIGWPIIRTSNGTRAVAEQVDEIRYATEYDSPNVTKVTETKEPADPIHDPKNSGEMKVSTRSESVSEGLPTAFDTRNAGITIEVDPTVADDGKTIGISIVAQHVRLLGFRKAEIEQKGTGRSAVVEQPEFLSNKITTSMEVQAGEITLLGVFKVPEPVDHVELFILQTRVVQQGDGKK